MRWTASAAIVGLLATTAVAGQLPPASVLTDAEVVQTLAAAVVTSPDMQVARMRNTETYRVNVVRRTSPQGAIAHDIGTEVHYIVEGRATLVTGGVIARGAPSAGGRPPAATITGGETRVVSKGDIVLVPVGTPHWYSQIAQPLTYLEVRFDVKEK